MLLSERSSVSSVLSEPSADTEVITLFDRSRCLMFLNPEAAEISPIPRLEASTLSSAEENSLPPSFIFFVSSE